MKMKKMLTVAVLAGSLLLGSCANGGGGNGTTSEARWRRCHSNRFDV